MKFMKAFFTAWLPAVLVTFLVSSIVQSQFVLAELQQLGVYISFSSRISTTVDDLIGLLPGYGAIIGTGLTLAFILASWCKKTFHTSSWIFLFAGFTAMFTIYALMHPLMEITLIAGARSTAGLVCQCLAGALGGIVFAVINRSEEEVDLDE